MSYLQGELMRVRNVSMAPEFQTQRSLPTFRMQLPSVTAPIPNIGVAATYSTIPPSTHREGASLDITFGLGSYSLNDPQGSHSHGSDFVGMRMYNSGEGTSYGNLHFVNKTIMENFLKITDAPASASRNNTEDYISQVHIHDAFEESMMDMHIEGPGK
ncbi:uncharacterized protein [Typha latifolia]|uniref:uncharacterized protein n=1 Tax=Typha latifolia TaxID=4733 RepID=UPI003C2BDC69